MAPCVFFGFHLQPTKKDEGVVWIKGSHLWNKLFLRVLFKDGHKIEGDECVVNGKKYELPPDILGNKKKYEFLHWDCEPLEMQSFLI